ncbi:MAG: polysaccharide biosynthesis/export family protein [Oscillospiraceae bacterium]
MKLKLNNKYWILFLLVMTSCASPKDIVYFQDSKNYASKEIEQSFNVKIQVDDLLAITVNNKNPELALPFNLPTIAYQAGKGEQLTTAQQMQGYLVDSEGNIDFPILGVIHVEGMTRLALTKLVKNRLIEGDYMKDPVVSVKLLNYKISVMGEVNKPGSFDINSDRITVLEALSLAGDLSIYGKRDKVMVIREENGVRNVVNLNLKSGEIFNSPYFYLQQNDVVYVEPNKSRVGQSTYNSNLPLLVSSLSILTTVILFFFK